VTSLLSPSYLNRGHVLYVDNWYGSPLLFRYLHQNDTGACGTVTSNCKLMPKFVKNLNEDRLNAIGKMLLAMKWHDK